MLSPLTERSSVGRAMAFILSEGSSPSVPSCEVEQMAARQVHTLEVAGSNPAFAIWWLPMLGDVPESVISDSGYMTYW